MAIPARIIEMTLNARHVLRYAVKQQTDICGVISNTAVLGIMLRIIVLSVGQANTAQSGGRASSELS